MDFKWTLTWPRWILKSKRHELICSLISSICSRFYFFYFLFHACYSLLFIVLLCYCSLYCIILTLFFNFSHYFSPIYTTIPRLKFYTILYLNIYTISRLSKQLFPLQHHFSSELLIPPSSVHRHGFSYLTHSNIHTPSPVSLPRTYAHTNSNLLLSLSVFESRCLSGSSLSYTLRFIQSHRCISWRRH